MPPRYKVGRALDSGARWKVVAALSKNGVNLVLECSLLRLFARIDSLIDFVELQERRRRQGPPDTTTSVPRSGPQCRGLEEAQSRSFTDASTASKKQLPGVYVKAGCDCIPIFAMNSWNAPWGVGFAFFFAAEEEAEEEEEDVDAEDSSAEEGETDERDVDTEDSSAEEEDMDEEDDDDGDGDGDDNDDEKERFSDPVVIAAAVEDDADAAAL